MPVCLLVKDIFHILLAFFEAQQIDLTFFRFMQKGRNIFEVRMGHSGTKVDRQPKVRTFLKGVGANSKNGIQSPGMEKSPFDNIQVVCNDLTASDLDIVPINERKGNRERKTIFPQMGEKLNDLAEHRVLKGAASRLNKMLAATRSFFW